MEDKIEAVLNKHATFGALCRAVYGATRLHLGFALLGVLCLGFSLMALAMFAVTPRVASRRMGRKLIARLFQFYLRLLVLMGACQFDLTELDALNGGPAMIIAPNHPSLLDAVMILSR